MTFRFYLVLLHILTFPNASRCISCSEKKLLQRSLIQKKSLRKFTVISQLPIRFWKHFPFLQNPLRRTHRKPLEFRNLQKRLLQNLQITKWPFYLRSVSKNIQNLLFSGVSLLILLQIISEDKRKVSGTVGNWTVTLNVRNSFCYIGKCFPNILQCASGTSFREVKLYVYLYPYIIKI